MRLLLVDDDENLRQVLRMTFESFDVLVDEADGAATAREQLAAERPDVILLDVVDAGHRRSRLLSRAEGGCRHPLDSRRPAQRRRRARGGRVGALRRRLPVEALQPARGALGRGAARRGPLRRPVPRDAQERPEEQLLLYARDLRHLLELERGQRALLQNAYHQTVSALASALEQKDTGTGAHSQRVERYAVALARAIDPELADDQSAVYGFLLHDVGKIGVPDSVLLKPGPLTPGEWRQMRTHTVLGAQMLGDVVLLRGEGLRVVRSHHERWDGHGYPDSRGGEEIPIGARIFAVADTLDAMTSDRPYRKATGWSAARKEILAGRGSQFDPDAVDAFRGCERELREIRQELDA